MKKILSIALLGLIAVTTGALVDSAEAQAEICRFTRVRVEEDQGWKFGIRLKNGIPTGFALRPKGMTQTPTIKFAVGQGLNPNPEQPLEVHVSDPSFATASASYEQKKKIYSGAITPPELPIGGAVGAPRIWYAQAVQGVTIAGMQMFIALSDPVKATCRPKRTSRGR